MSFGTKTKRYDLRAVAQEVADFLQHLVAIESAYPPGNTERLNDHCAALLRDWGYTVSRHAAEPGLDNLVARTGSGRPSLVFNAHADTVSPGEGWSTDPYRLVRDGEFLYGLGASNCKGSLAAQLWVARELSRLGGPRAGEVVFTIVTDEECLGPRGMKLLKDEGIVSPDMLLLGAPTNNQLVVAERGVMWVELVTRGRTAHAGAPETGDNAIARMARVIGALESRLKPCLAGRKDGPLRSTMSLGTIRGGTNTNVVPAECRLQIDRRLLVSETVEGAVAEIADIVAACGEPEGTCAVELLTGTGAYRAREDGPLVRALVQASEEVVGKRPQFVDATGASDGRHFAADGIEILNFGPGAGAAGHAANEWVPLMELGESAVVQLRAVTRLNSD